MNSLKSAFEYLGIPFDEELIAKFEGYMNGILEWNEKVNLTAITDVDEFIKKHFIDSVLCYNFDEFKNAKSVVDVGTGGGFPGIPLALVFPEIEFTLIDSLNKRLKIIDELCLDLNITNVKTLHGRAEDLAHKKEYREQFDLCVSRAVANLATLSEYCLPFIKRGGSFLAYKAVKADDEIKEGKNAVFLLGGKIEREDKIDLPSFDLAHNIVVINKVQNTSAKYPRKAGMPSKQPLK